MAKAISATVSMTSSDWKSRCAMKKAWGVALKKAGGGGGRIAIRAAEAARQKLRQDQGSTTSRRSSTSSARWMTLMLSFTPQDMGCWCSGG